MSSRVILITGANGALGRSIARAFLHEAKDHLVWLGVNAHRDQAERLAAEFSPQCRLIALDVRDPVQWQNGVAEILARDSRLDVLVNNAGKHSDNLLANMPPSAWEEVLATNLDGAFHGCQAVLPAMILQRSGRIVNVTSLSAFLAPAGQTNYAAAKAGLVALTQSLAKEVARLNITVNAVCPGFIDTEALSSMTADERQVAQGKIPMRRFGKPEEVAVAVRFLACPEASYITGSVLKIDGGIF